MIVNHNRLSRLRGNVGSRPAFTLIETVATLSLLLVLAISAVRMLSFVTEIGTQASNENRARSSIQRLSKSLHTDSGSADRVQADQWPITIDSDDVQVRYDYDAPTHSIRRTVSKDSKRIAVERFELSNRCEPVLEADDDFVRLDLMRGPSVTWTIEVPKR